MKRFGISILFLLTAVAITGCSSSEDQPPVSGTSTASASPFPESGYKAAITMVSPPPQTLKAGGTASVKAKVKNMGTVAWPAPVSGAKYRVALGDHWLDKSGKTVVIDDGRTDLPHDIKPGEDVELTLPINAPKAPGDYILQLDMVHEGLSWFAAHGSQTVKINIIVQ
ncbi:MAG: NBR1-Ig-like domain-containing protein [bacterium]